MKLGSLPILRFGWGLNSYKAVPLAASVSFSPACLLYNMPVLNESASSLVEGWLSSLLCGASTRLSMSVDD